MTDFSVGRTPRKRVLYGMTRSVCPSCLRLVDARIEISSNRVFLRKWCPEHGWSEALISSDARRYHERRRLSHPGSRPLAFEREFHGCPTSCGICPEHQQHACLAIIDVTQTCNLECPACFASSGGRGSHLSLTQISDMMDRVLRTEGKLEALQLSGGEPTLHPQIFDIVAMARAKGIRKVLLNTNGLRIDRDEEFAEKLADVDPTIYLQFDGFEPATYEALRGRDLSSMKLRVLDRLSGLGMRIVLVATIARGVNEQEVGRLIDLAVDHPNIRSLNFQPATHVGRFQVGDGLDERKTEGRGEGRGEGGKGGPDSLDRVTLDEVASLAAAQSRYGLRPEDFFPIPCPDPACSLVTYLHKREGQDRATPVSRLVDVDRYSGLIANSAVPSLTDQLKDALSGLIAPSVSGPNESGAVGYCATCGIDVDWLALEREITMISMMHFMDADTFDLTRAVKCCIHQILPDDGGMIPFCNYNVFHRNRAAGSRRADWSLG